MSSRGIAPVSRGQRGIGPEDINRALDAARAVPIPHNREIIHTLARSWTVDEQQGVRDPIGMHGFRCLLYTSDAADERSSVDLGGRRIIKKKNREKTDGHGI